jgi:hypothetical protein
VGYSYPSGLEKTLCKWEVYVPLVTKGLRKVELFRLIFKRYSYNKFHENQTSGGRLVPCGQTDRQMDMTKLTVAFRNFASAPVNKMGRECDSGVEEIIE